MILQSLAIVIPVKLQIVILKKAFLSELIACHRNTDKASPVFEQNLQTAYTFAIPVTRHNPSI